MSKSVALFSLALLLSLQPVYGQIDACLEKAQPPTVNVGLWSNVREYFSSLTQDKTTLERARFTMLRSTLVTLESAKMELIALVESPLAENVAGTAMSKEIGLKNAPDILKRIEVFTTGLDHPSI